VNHRPQEAASQHGPSAQQANSRDYLVFGQVAEEVNACLRANQEPDVEALVQRYPGLAVPIREMLGTLVVLHRLGPRSDAGTQSASAGTGPVVGQLGDFQILREVGRGGMGVVYEALQISLGRRVALKVLPFAATLDAKPLQRFKNEAQAAAQLHHPNIVPVFAVGCERGVHYYAMQFIEGQTVANLIQELRSSRGWEGAAPKASADQADFASRLASGGRTPEEVADRARDFRDVESAQASGMTFLPDPPASSAGDDTVPVAAISTECALNGRSYFRTVANLGIQAAEALEHAHDIGVVHRDVKPANLLIDVRGNLWITDFGLAQFQSVGALTVTGDVVGTLRYMSPEQALGKRGLVDQRADIYALGVTLYELLTLRPAHSGQEREELLRQIAFEEPDLPRRVNPAVPIDLQTIVRKAMAKEPEGRYATSQELADDLRCFLEDKPIRAKPPTLGERAAKWTRRHRPLVGAGVALLAVAGLAMALGTLLIWRAQRHTETALQQARQKQLLAQQVVNEMFTDLADQWLEHEPHQELQQRKFLLKALAYYQQFARENATDPDIRQATGRAARRAGDIQQRLGEYEEAHQAYAEAARILGQLAQEYPGLPDYRADLADCANSRGILLVKTGQLQAAQETFRQAVATYEKLVTDSSAGSDYRRHLVTAYRNLAGILIDSARQGEWYPEAERTYLRARLLIEQLVAEDPECAAYQHDLARSLSDLGHLYWDAGRLADAENNWRRALGVAQPLAMRFPGIPAYTESLAESHYRVACLLTATERTSEAEPHLNETVSLRKQLANNFPRKLEYRIGLGTTHVGRAALLRETGRLPEAEQACQEALAMWRDLAAKFPDNGDCWRNRANAYDELGIILKDTGRLREAEEAFIQAVGLIKGQPAGAAEAALSRAKLSNYQSNLASLYWQTGRLADAERLYREVLAVRTNLAEESPSLPAYRVALVGVHTNLAHLLRSAGRFHEAEDAYRRALARGQEPGSGQALDARSGPRLADVHNDLAQLLRLRGCLEESHHEFQKAAQEWGRLVARWPDRPGPRNSFARFLANCPDGQLRDPARAVELATWCVTRAPQAGPLWSTLGMAHYRAGNYPAALAALEKASQLRSESDRCSFFFLAMTHWQLGHKEEAIRWYERAVRELEDDHLAKAASAGYRDEATVLLGRQHSRSRREATSR
jgi:serine/threonine protein kinase/tetratricopeptide (TPR) repeat protein